MCAQVPQTNTNNQCFCKLSSSLHRFLCIEKDFFFKLSIFTFGANRFDCQLPLFPPFWDFRAQIHPLHKKIQLFCPPNMMIFKLSVLFCQFWLLFSAGDESGSIFLAGIFFSVTTQWLNACTWELASKTFSTACQSRSKLFWAAKKPAQQHWTLHSALKSRKSVSLNICEGFSHKNAVSVEKFLNATTYIFVCTTVPFLDH